MKKIIFLFIAASALILFDSCGKKETCPTYAESKFLSPKKYRRQIKQYQSGKLTKKLKEQKEKEKGDQLKNAKKIQTKPVPKENN